MKKYVHLFSCLLLALARLAGCGITSAGKDRGAGETSSSGSGSKAQLLPTTRTKFVSDLKMLFADKGLELQAMSEELPQDNGQELTDRYAVRDPADPTRSWGGLTCTYQKSGQLLSVTVDGKLTALTDSTDWYTPRLHRLPHRQKRRLLTGIRRAGYPRDHRWRRPGPHPKQRCSLPFYVP